MGRGAAGVWAGRPARGAGAEPAAGPTQLPAPPDRGAARRESSRRPPAGARPRLGKCRTSQGLPAPHPPHPHLRARRCVAAPLPRLQGRLLWPRGVLGPGRRVRQVAERQGPDAAHLPHLQLRLARARAAPVRAQPRPRRAAPQATQWRARALAQRRPWPASSMSRRRMDAHALTCAGASVAWPGWDGRAQRTRQRPLPSFEPWRPPRRSQQQRRARAWRCLGAGGGVCPAPGARCACRALAVFPRRAVQADPTPCSPPLVCFVPLHGPGPAPCLRGDPAATLPGAPERLRPAPGRPPLPRTPGGRHRRRGAARCGAACSAALEQCRGLRALVPPRPPTCKTQMVTVLARPPPRPPRRAGPPWPRLARPCLSYFPTLPSTGPALHSAALPS
jgi:hypothetical protein